MANRYYLRLNFHLGQEWFRKLQNLSLSKIYIDKDTDKESFFNYIFGLPFLKLEEVENLFVFFLFDGRHVV